MVLIHILDTPESFSRIFAFLNFSIRAAGWQRRDFRNLLPCAEILLGATLSVWRRVHCERLRVVPCTLLSLSRGRLRGSGVFEACSGHAAARCRGDWRRGVLRARMADVRFSWQAAGIGCAAGVPRACGGAVSAAPCRGDWRRGVLRARMILRDVTCVSRGRRGAPDACPRSGRHWRVDPRGRRGEACVWNLVRARFLWQVWGRVATGGVANMDSRARRGGKRARGVRFAWQAWGMVRPVASLGIVLRGRCRESCAAAETARFRGPVREFGCAGPCSRVSCCEIVAGAGNPWTCG